jgi:hypothetical protein
MARYAEIRDGVVAQIVDLPDGVNIEDAVHPDLLANFVEASGSVEVGSTFSGGNFNAPSAPPDVAVDLLAYAANLRWQIETGGIVIAGVPVATDDRSKMMILGARVAAAANEDWSTVWHGADGGSYPLNAGGMIAISDAVEAHVNATFATFASIKVDIEAGDITTSAEIDAAFA